jgi:hypothetical protein
MDPSFEVQLRHITLLSAQKGVFPFTRRSTTHVPSIRHSPHYRVRLGIHGYYSHQVFFVVVEGSRVCREKLLLYNADTDYFLRDCATNNDSEALRFLQ